jgi:hypothetical protein
MWVLVVLLVLRLLRLLYMADGEGVVLLVLCLHRFLYISTRLTSFAEGVGERDVGARCPLRLLYI